MRLRRVLLLLLAVYFVLFGGGSAALQSLPLRLFHQALLTGLLLVWAIGAWRRGGLPATPLNLLLPVVWAAWLLTSLLGLDARLSLEHIWVAFTQTLLLLVLVGWWRADRRQTLALGAFVAVLVIIMAGFQLASWYLGLGVFPNTEVGWLQTGQLVPLLRPNLFAPLGVTTWLAAFCAPLAVFFGLWGLAAPTRGERRGFLLLAALLLLLVLLTFSRGGIIALGAGAAALVGLRLLRSVRTAQGRPRALAAVIVVGLVGAGAALVILISRSPERVAGDALRLDLWRGALAMAAADPLTGVGPGMYGRAFRDLRDPHIADDRLSTAHNLILTTTAEMGLPGLALLVILALVIGRAAWRAWRAAEMPRERLRLEGALAGLAAFAAQSQFDTFVMPAVVAAPFFLLAYVLASAPPAAAGVTSPPHALSARRKGEPGSPSSPAPFAVRRPGGEVLIPALAALLLVMGGAGLAWSGRAQLIFAASVRDGSLAGAQEAAALDPAVRLYTLYAEWLTAHERRAAGDLPGATAALERAVALEHTWDVGWMTLAEFYAQAGQTDAALAALERAARIKAANGARLGWARLADAADAAPDDEIIQAYVEGARRQPWPPLADWWAATPRREAALQRLLNELPADSAFRVAQALVPTALLGTIPAEPRTTVEWWIAGQMALAADDRAAARAAFETVIALDPLYGEGYLGRAAAAEVGQADPRDVALARLLGTRLDSAMMLARARLSVGAPYEAALAEALPPRTDDLGFEGVLYNGRLAGMALSAEMRQPGPGRLTLSPWYELAVYYEGQGQTEQAIRVYRAILDMAADEALARERLAALGG